MNITSVKEVYDAIAGSTDLSEVSWVINTEEYGFINEVKQADGESDYDIRLPNWEDIKLRFEHV